MKSLLLLMSMLLLLLLLLMMTTMLLMNDDADLKTSTEELNMKIAKTQKCFETTKEFVIIYTPTLAELRFSKDVAS